LKNLARFRGKPVPAAWRGRIGFPNDPLGDQGLRRPRLARHSEGPLRQTAWPGAGHRSHRLGKIDHLAAMLDKINSEREEHMITIEDPIEFLHNHKKCLVNQREVHSDTHSFANSLEQRSVKTPMWS